MKAAHTGEYAASVYVVTADFRRNLDGYLIELKAGDFVADFSVVEQLLAADAPIERTEMFLTCPCCKATLSRAEATLDSTTLPSPAENATREIAAHRRSLATGATTVAGNVIAIRNAEQRRARVAELEGTKVFPQ